MMDKLKLAENLSLSRIAYGMWRIGDDEDTSAAHIQKKIEICLEQGITTIDQADIYGGYEAEELLGNCLREASGLRDKIEIVTKCDIVAPVGRYSDVRVKYYNTSAEHIRHSVDMSLKLMGIEHIDLLLVHRPDPFMDHHETGRALDEVVKSGKVRAAGVSNFKPHDWNLLQSTMQTRLATNQIELSLLANEGFTNGDVAFLQQNGVSPMAWSPLAGGNLFAAQNSGLFERLESYGNEHGADATAVAIAWLLAHPSGIIPVMGTNRLDRISQFSDCLKVPMGRQTWFEFYTLANGHEVP